MVLPHQRPLLRRQGLILFFDVSGLAQKHLSFSSRYADFYSEVLDTLSKPTRCRPVASTFQVSRSHP